MDPEVDHSEPMLYSGCSLEVSHTAATHHTNLETAFAVDHNKTASQNVHPATMVRQYAVEEVLSLETPSSVLESPMEVVDLVYRKFPCCVE